MSNPGIRYERLLFWAAPITLAAGAVFVSTVGYSTYDDRVAANCFESAAVVVEADLQSLSEKWADVQNEQAKTNGRNTSLISYGSEISTKLIYGLKSSCWRIIGVKEFALQQDPSIVSSGFRALAADLRKQPVKMYGIEIPDVAMLGLAGTTIQIAMANFVQLLQVALAPIMLLWLGSLYHTRFREVLSFKKHDNILGVHPHVINVFPVGHFPGLRRKSWLKSKAPVLWATCFFFIRSSLVFCFVAPSVVLYVGSLLYQPIFGYWALNLLAAIGVGLYAFGVFIIELTPGLKYFDGDGALR